MSETTGQPETTRQPAAAAAPPQQPPVQIDDSKAVGLYANFCRVTGTPEES